jgi:tRNA 2-thiocytidine biosynthesis protein TtcA
MFTAIRNVVPSHLCDSELFDFKSINAQSGVINGGDIAFDDELIVAPVLDDNISIEHNSKNNLSFNNALNIIEIK